MRVLVGLLALALLIAPSLGAQLKVACKNPGHPYLVTYNAGQADAVVDPDSKAIHQKVLAASADFLVLDLGQPGMVSVLLLGDSPKNEIFSGGKLVQTDPCK